MWRLVGMALCASGCVFDPSGVPTEHAFLTDLLDGPGEAAPDLDAADLPAVDLADAGPADRAGDLPPWALGQDDARLWVGLKGGVLELWRHDAAGGGWSAETSNPVVTGDVYYARSELVPDASQELGAVKVVNGSDTQLTLLRRTSTAGWAPDFTHTVSGTTNADKQDYDLARERASGDLLLVYADGTKTPLFRTFSGGSWSAPVSVPINDGATDLTGGTVLWVRLVPRAMSNVVTLLYADESADLGALLWDGSQWDVASARLLETDLKVNPNSGVVGNRCFDGAWETSSGDLLVAWGIDGGNQVRYAVRSAGGSWSGASTISVYAGKTEYVELAADPQAGSDRVAAAFVDLGNGTERLGLGVWDGAGWVGLKEYDNAIHDVNDKGTGDLPAALAWVGTTGTAVCVYADTGSNISWRSWSAGSSDWVGQSDAVVSSMGTMESAILRPLATRDEVLLVLSDDKSQLYVATGDGSSWTVAPGGPRTKALARTDAVPFSLAVQP